jgi:hypothetical protein
MQAEPITVDDIIDDIIDVDSESSDLESIDEDAPPDGDDWLDQGPNMHQGQSGCGMTMSLGTVGAIFDDDEVTPKRVRWARRYFNQEYMTMAFTLLIIDGHLNGRRMYNWSLE